MLNVVLLMVLFLFPAEVFADKVYLKGGEVIEGTIIEQNEAFLKLKQDNGIIRQFFQFQYDSFEKDLPDPDAVQEPEPFVLEELTPVEGISEDKQELIEQMIELTGMRINVEAIVNRVIDKAPLERREEFRAIFDVEEILEALKPIYDKYYTTEDLQKLVTLYNSPLGKKMLEVTPQISRDAMQATLLIYQKKLAP